MLVRKEGLSLKQEGKINVCYVIPVLLHCCATLELTVENEVILHRVERRMIYIYYIIFNISYINIYRISSRHNVSLTWDLKPIPLFLCSHVCSTELARLKQERSNTVNVYTRSHIKEHKVVTECWQLIRSEPHLR